MFFVDVNTVEYAYGGLLFYTCDEAGNNTHDLPEDFSDISDYLPVLVYWINAY